MSDSVACVGDLDPQALKLCRIPESQYLVARADDITKIVDLISRTY